MHLQTEFGVTGIPLIWLRNDSAAACYVICRVLCVLGVAGVDLPTADKMKVLGVVLDRRLAFNNYVTAVTRSCNYHAQVIVHIRHLLTTELAQTLACSLILSRIDYCNAVLHPWCSNMCRTVPLG